MILDTYLSNHNLTRYRLAKDSGISQSTWSSVNTRPIDRWTVKQVQALATITGNEPTTVLRELEALENEHI